MITYNVVHTWIKYTNKENVYTYRVGGLVASTFHSI